MTNEYKNLIDKIPKEVLKTINQLENAGFEAFLVGGCVRDLILGNKPKDWDITTNAKPEEIIKLFEKTIYENDFGTVLVITEDVSDETLRQIEITPYRVEAKYSDLRHPDQIKFSDKLEEDLKRRDFTINAMAVDSKGHLTDIFEGLKDIYKRTLRTVGKPDDRFKEDALRMLRVVRFSVELSFTVSHETTESIVKNADLIKKISVERIRDEFIKIIMSPSPAVGITILQKFGLLRYIIPELEEGIGCEQLGEHIYDVWNHLLHAVQYTADKGMALEVRLAALFHDIGKPRSRRVVGERLTRDLAWSGRARLSTGEENRGPDKSLVTFLRHPSAKKYTFYGHEVVGARMTKKIMERLKFPRKDAELVEKLVRNHMFFSDPEKITLSAVRRTITKVGKENIWTLMSVREADRVGMRKKETPYRLRRYFAMIEEALRDPISFSQLKIDGNFMMQELGIKPGPRMGWILHALLEEVLDDPSKNNVEHLSALVKSLDMLPDDALRTLGERGKEKKEGLEEKEIGLLHKKHGVD